MFQILPMTREEKIKAYMRLPKKKLAEMLATANEHIDSLPLKIGYMGDNTITNSCVKGDATTTDINHPSNKYRTLTTGAASGGMTYTTTSSI